MHIYKTNNYKSFIVIIIIYFVLIFPTLKQAILFAADLETSPENCGGTCLTYLTCSNIPTNTYFKYYSNLGAYGDIVDDASTDYNCKFCFAIVYNLSGSDKSFCKQTLISDNALSCRRCLNSTSTWMHVNDYNYSDSLDLCVCYLELDTYYTQLTQCSSSQITGECESNDADSIGSCPIAP